MLKIIAVSGLCDIIIGICEDESSDWIDGLSIMVAVFLIILITAGNNWMQQKQFEKLYREAEVYTLQVKIILNLFKKNDFYHKIH